MKANPDLQFSCASTFFRQPKETKNKQTANHSAAVTVTVVVSCLVFGPIIVAISCIQLPSASVFKTLEKYRIFNSSEAS
jgi:hypothetical protein